MLLRNSEPNVSPPKRDGQLSIWSIPRRMALCFAIERIFLRKSRCRVSIVVRHVCARIIATATAVLFIEYESIRAIVDAEMTKIIESRKRSSHEEAYRRRRSDVEQHYNRLKSSGKEKILPNLAEFRRLPIINVLQSKTSTTTGVAGDLQKSQLVAELLQDNLNKWRESARIALTPTLGFSDWKSASKTKLHPVDRVTARFRCKKCARNDCKIYEEGCLDFAGACAHVCLRPNLKKGTRDRWTADQFEKDEKVHTLLSSIVYFMYPML